MGYGSTRSRCGSTLARPPATKGLSPGAIHQPPAGSGQPRGRGDARQGCRSGYRCVIARCDQDQEVPRELIEREFGKRVAEVVSQVTDDKTLPKENRKEIQVKTAVKKTSDAKIIKLADKTSNMRAITFSPAPNWSVKRRLEYIGWARDVVQGLRGVSPWLEQQFDNAAAEAESSIAVRRCKAVAEAAKLAETSSTTCVGAGQA